MSHHLPCGAWVLGFSMYVGGTRFVFKSNLGKRQEIKINYRFMSLLFSSKVHCFVLFCGGTFSPVSDLQVWWDFWESGAKKVTRAYFRGSRTRKNSERAWNFVTCVWGDTRVTFPRGSKFRTRSLALIDQLFLSKRRAYLWSNTDVSLLFIMGLDWIMTKTNILIDSIQR